MFFQDTATFSLLQFGDEIIIQSKINEIQSAMNPYEFDSKIFYGLKKIYFQSYVSPDKFQVIAHHQVSFLTKFIFDIRNFISLKFEKHIHDEAALGVCKA